MFVTEHLRLRQAPIINRMLEYSRGNGQLSDVTGHAGVTGRLNRNKVQVKKVVNSL